MEFTSGRVSSNDWLLKAMLVNFVLIIFTVTAYGQNSPSSINNTHRVLLDFESPVIDYTTASCPSGHTKYYLGAEGTTPSDADYKKVWSWPNSTTNRSFNFTDNTQINLSFPLAVDTQVRGRPSSPLISNDSSPSDALTLIHDNRGVKINHRLEIMLNKPVSKLGFIVYDIDSTAINRGRITYQEAIDVTTSGGRLYSPYTEYHNLTAPGRIESIYGKNCGNSTKYCPINVTWGDSPKDKSLTLDHSNLSVNEKGFPHVLGYADFYFCVAPPKLIVNKIFEGRAQPTDNFKIDIKNNENNSVIKSFNTLNTDNSGVIDLTTKTIYTISETSVDGTNPNSYTTKYSCESKNPNSTFTTLSGIGKTFQLPTLQEADKVVCTITNTAAVYTISSTVFNDNGGIISPEERDISPKYTDKTQYFNGVFDKTIESGIAYTTGHTITLDKCVSDSDNGATFTPQTVNIKGDGSYEMTVLKSQIGTNTALCLTQNEPASYDYAVDTTPNTKRVALSANVLTYPNNNFGDVIKKNAALVLTKRQYVRQCNAMPTSLSNISVNDNAEPTASFSSKKPSQNIEPGVCIAYMITAFNRGHIALNDIIINDVLQDKADKHSLYLDTPSSVPATFINFKKSPKPNTNGTIITNPFVLGVGKSSNFYFNTEYKSK